PQSGHRAARVVTPWRRRRSEPRGAPTGHVGRGRGRCLAGATFRCGGGAAAVAGARGPVRAHDAALNEHMNMDRAIHEPWPLTTWPDVPTRYLLCRDDRCFTPDFTRRHVRERLGIVPDEMPGSHMVMLSRPSELAAYLVDVLP